MKRPDNQEHSRRNGVNEAEEGRGSAPRCIKTTIQVYGALSQRGGERKTEGGRERERKGEMEFCSSPRSYGRYIRFRPTALFSSNFPCIPYSDVYTYT